MRELENWIERLLACHATLCDAQGVLDAARLQELFPECAAPPPASALKDTRHQAEQQRLREVLAPVNGDQRQACAILGISRATLWRRMKANRMSIYGCMLDYTLISAEMADEDLRAFIQKIGYIEAMPVVVDPGVLNPYEFIGAVINRRLPNPFMPDAPQRIATDTSQKLAIRFGETIKAYEARGLDKSNLVLIPLVLAGYARYLKGIDDNGKAFEISPDPMLAELQAIVAPLEVKEGEQDFSCLKNLYSRADIFGVDLYAVGLGEQIEGMVKELYAGNGAVRKTLHKYVVAR